MDPYLFGPEPGGKEKQVRSIGFHGRRVREQEGDFLLAAKIVGAAGRIAGLYSQVRSAPSPAPSGSPDTATVRLSTESLLEMDIPRRYDLEIVCDPLLAVFPPMGSTLLPGGRAIVNAPAPPSLTPGGPEVKTVDLEALSKKWEAPLYLALSGAAWAALLYGASEFALSFGQLGAASSEAPGRTPKQNHQRLLLASFEKVEELLKENRP